MNTATWHSLFWILAVLFMIPLALWLLKRTALGSRLGVVPGASVRLVSSTSISPSQRIITVEVGQGEHKRWLILGVTPQNINTLHTLPVSELATPASEEANFTPEAFSQLLKRLRHSEPKEKGDPSNLGEPNVK